eukprot:8694877-Pyramimonas_sp.AAC.1
MAAAMDRREGLAAARGAALAVHGAAGLARGASPARLLRSAEGIPRAAAASDARGRASSRPCRSC